MTREEKQERLISISLIHSQKVLMNTMTNSGIDHIKMSLTKHRLPDGQVLWLNWRIS